MTDETARRPAETAEIEQALAHAPQFHAWKHFKQLHYRFFSAASASGGAGTTTSIDPSVSQSGAGGADHSIAHTS
jgi:hypothetical protein